MNAYVIRKAEEYAEHNNEQKVGKYFILHCRIKDKMKELPFIGMT
jgi:hypothetical protein